MNFDDWLGALREVIQNDDSHLEYGEARWKVLDRRSAWHQFGARIFDSHLDVLKSCVVDVLTEVNPQFELRPEERYAAGVNGKVLRHSGSLREGLAETVALLGNEGDALKNCSRDKAKVTATLIVRELFAKNDWQIWASANSLLPTLAEGAPGEFLDAVQNALLGDESPFDELFNQEGSGVFGGTYISGLLWAMEGLAWSEHYLIRVATLLADLAARDPGGQWTNRPDNSLVSILLPWHPQTLAPFEKQLACLKAIQHDHPDVAWRVLLRLLPNQQQSTSGTHKPLWFMEVATDWKPSVTNADYYKWVAQYADMAVEMACSDLERLTELLGHMDNLPQSAFEKVVEYLSSGSVASLDEERRMPIWSMLTRFSRKHRRYQDAKWALPLDVVERLEEVSKALEPESPEGRYQHLFSNNDFDLYEENGDWEEQRRLLEEKRQQAVSEVWGDGNLERVLRYARVVDSPYQLGWAFSSLADTRAEATMLPGMLESDDKSFRFIEGFAWKRFQNVGPQWLDQLHADKWNSKQRAKLLTCLPFEQAVWEYAVDWLGDEETLYWRDVGVNPYFGEKDLIYAVDKLLEYGRPIAALDCLYARQHDTLPLDHPRAVAALIAAVSSDEPLNTMDQHHVLELIKALQEDDNTDPDDLFRVEWAYVPLLDRNAGAKPTRLEEKLATDPGFFCEAIQLIYRPDGEEKPEVVDEGKKAVATNAWHLLHEWKRPPGMHNDGSFDAQELKAWFEIVKERCRESGHLQVAMIKVGEVLFYCPEDPGGLWIDAEVAKLLNASDADNMRDGFRTEVFNSRGVHWVDPTGQPERELAQQWRHKAEAVEEAGYARFGATLRRLADSYDRDAERVLAEHADDD